MSKQVYSIRRSFLIPLGLLLVLALVLLVVVLVQNQPLAKAVILAFIILPVLVLFVESARRRARIGEDGVTVEKVLRTKTLQFADVTAVETVAARKRVFFTLCAGDDFLIFSNSYGDFPSLVATLLARVPESAISEETRKMAAAPPSKSTDVISCWLGVALLVFILFLQLRGGG